MNWLSTKTISQRMQVPPSKVEKWKANKSVPTLPERYMLADIHECDPSVFAPTDIVHLKKAGRLWKATYKGHKIVCSVDMGAVDDKIFMHGRYKNEMERYLTTLCCQRILLAIAEGE